MLTNDEMESASGLDNTDKPPIDSYSLDKCIFVNVKGTSYTGVYLSYSIPTIQ